MTAHTEKNNLMPATCKTHSFRRTLAKVTEITDAIENALLEAGCDDAGLGSCDGVVTIHFDRESESLGDAISSAVNDIERAGYGVAKIEVGAKGHQVN